jgi:uncharacterized protein YndB with AHSA1/START domain
MDIPLVMEQVYNAPLEKVWCALTEVESMREWYFPQLENFKPVEGFDFVFKNDGSPYQKSWKVTKVEEGTLLAHSWTYVGYSGISEVIFKLLIDGEGTRLQLIHVGIGSFPNDPHFARQRFESGWENILGNNLRNYLSKEKEETRSL